METTINLSFKNNILSHPNQKMAREVSFRLVKSTSNLMDSLIMRRKCCLADQRPVVRLAKDD
jgi:hypothetical protein